MTGYIYFIGNEASEILKIGFTGSDPRRRLRGIQTGCPVPLTLFAYVSGDTALERLLHETFAPVAMHGEWFRLKGKLWCFLSYMEQYAEERGALVSQDDFEVAISDNVCSLWAPFPGMDEAEYVASANASLWPRLEHQIA